MKIKISYFVLILIFSTLTGMSQIIYVDAGNTGLENGSLANPFNTIKEGIAAATPGDTVFIWQGIYFPDESLSGTDSTLFLKAGVKLIGEGADKSIVDGYIVDASVSTLPIGIEKLRFKAFSFARGTIAGPFAGQSIIRNCKTGLIAIVHGKSIPVNDTTPGPIYGFVIENNDLGEGPIEFKQGPGIAENSVSGNTAGYIELASGAGFTYFIDNNDVQIGIFDRSGACRTTISNNRIYNGAIIDKSGGLGYGTEDEIIENNVITATENSPAFIDEDYKAGISASSRSVTIRGNTITCTGNISGIRSLAGAPLHILNNIITIDEVQQPNPDPYEGTSGILNYSGWGYVTGNKIHGGNMGYYSKAGTVEFADNEIEKSYTGFYSKGGEETHHNVIKNCYGDGMQLDGLKGPIHHNKITNNAGAGIRVTRVPIDLGGGEKQCPGLNEITGNGNYDLYVESQGTQFPLLYACYNLWDHADTIEILQYDIRDGNDTASLVKVTFTPFNGLGIKMISACNQITISPNPAGQKATFSWMLLKRCSVSLTILDNTGKLIKTLVSKQLSPGEYTAELDVSCFSEGNYLYRFIADGVTQTGKMVVYR
jgi:hypothetical protein